MSPGRAPTESSLYKTYEAIVGEDDAKPEGQRALSAEDRARLIDKAKRLHDELEALPHRRRKLVRNDLA